MKPYTILFSLCFLLFAACNKEEHTDDVPPHRTVIIYMAADNDLSDNAWDNISDMESGFAEGGARLVVFMGLSLVEIFK